MNIIVRIADVIDAPIITEFNAAMALETERLKLDPERLAAGVKALLVDPAKGFYCIAELNGAVVGQLMITYEWSDWRNATFWWMQSVYVLPVYRKQGVFKALYRYIESLACNQGLVCGLRLYVEQENDRALKTYEALGMTRSHYQMMEVGFKMK